MLPDIDGIEVCRQIRAFSHCSILFLSSKNDDVDKILGLASGGDDYVTKPFSPKEIVYRVKSQLRRMQYARADTVAQKSSTLCAGDITVDIDACCAYKAGKLLELTAKEYGVLQFMMENQNKIISKEHLYSAGIGKRDVLQTHYGGAQEEAPRYDILRKTGMKKGEVLSSVAKQLGLIYEIPFFVGLSHTVFALLTYNRMLGSMGQQTPTLQNAAMAVILFAAVYSAFYALSVKSYHGIVWRRVDCAEKCRL